MFKDIIPGWLFNSEPTHLYNIASKYNRADAVGVEVGCLHGRSSAILSQAISSGVLYCIDPWENSINMSNRKNIDLYKNRFPLNGVRNSFSYFSKNVRDYSNIRTIQGHSPQCVQGWNQKIDFLFLDAVHHNPSDRENIDFWLPFIRSGGSLFGHDYGINYPDIVENVRYLELKLGVQHQLYDSIWVVQVP